VRTDEFYDVAEWRVEQDFIDAVRGGAAYRPDFHDGLKYMQVIDAVYEAAQSGCAVELS
jgi:predicted dehydrogenase